MPDVGPGQAVSVEDRTNIALVTIPKDVGLFGDVTDHIRGMCITHGASHFKDLADSYPVTKRFYAGENCFLNSCAFKRVLLNGEVVGRDWLVYSPVKTCVSAFLALYVPLISYSFLVQDLQSRRIWLST